MSDCWLRLGGDLSLVWDHTIAKCFICHERLLSHYDTHHGTSIIIM